MADVVKRRHDGTFVKIKRTKHDAVKVTVNSYLARRHYTENELRKKSISCGEMLISHLVNKEIARPNSILFSNSSYRNTFNNDPNPVQVESYFCKFVTWINNLTNKPVKNDLLKLLPPLFCHLYIDLLQSNNLQSANIYKFYQEQKITETDYCSQIVKEIILPDAKSRPLVKSFRSTKYKIKLLLETINILKNYLSSNGHILILQVLQTWFDVEINSSVSQEHINESDNDFLSVCNGDVNNMEFDEDLQKLQNVINDVNQLPPSLLVVNVFNSQDNATCGYTSNKNERVIVGFSTSEIRIWGMGLVPLPNTRIGKNASTITLACDTIVGDGDSPYDKDSLSATGAAILRGHGASIQDLKIVSEADVLLSVSQDCTMRAWRLSDYSCACVYRGHNYPIWCLDTSCFGMYMATGSVDNSVRLWTLDKTYPVRILAGHTKDVNCLNFHPNASYLASGSADKTVRMWSVSESKSVRLFLGHKGTVYSTAYSPDGKYLASAGEDKVVKIWDLVSAKQLTELVGCDNIISNICWSKDSRYIAATSFDSCVKIWDTTSTQKSTGVIEPSSIYNTGYSSLLSLKYDSKWLTCLSASTTF